MKRPRPRRRPRPTPASRAGSWFAPTRRADVATRALRGVVVVAIACGPAGLTLHWTGATPSDRPDTSPTPRDEAAAALGPSGWAERAIGAYLSGDVEAIRMFFPSVSQLPKTRSIDRPMRTSTVAATRAGQGYWAVTVAVSTPRSDPQTPLARYYSLGVVRSGAGWVAAGMPSEVAVPAPGDGRELDYASQAVPTGELTDTVEHWASAYLAAEGELDRYLAPGFTQTPISPAPYSAVDLRAVYPRADQEERARKKPGDGAVVEVLAHLDAHDDSEEPTPLAYALELTARSGRWEVSALRPAPLVAGDDNPDTPAN